jgi:hypothetical protein
MQGVSSSEDLLDISVAIPLTKTFDIVPVVVTPVVNKTLSTGSAELKIMTDIGTNDSSLIELTSLNFATLGATEAKEYRIINIDSSGS